MGQAFLWVGVMAMVLVVHAQHLVISSRLRRRIEHLETVNEKLAKVVCQSVVAPRSGRGLPDGMGVN